MLTWPLIIQCLIWTIFILVWVIKLPPKKDTTTHRSRGFYNGALYITGTLALACYLTGITTIAPLPWQSELGVAITLVGLAFAIHARAVIGDCWTFKAVANTKGTFIDRFPYSVVRHPIYSGQLLMCLGTSLSVSNVAFFIIFTLGSYALLLQRAKNEEAILDAASGGKYAARFAQLGRFLPRLHR